MDYSNYIYDLLDKINEKTSKFKELNDNEIKIPILKTRVANNNEVKQITPICDNLYFYILLVKIQKKEMLMKFLMIWKIFVLHMN